MIVKILNCKHPGILSEGNKALQIWMSPDKKYAVAEVFAAESFVAGLIEEVDEEKGIMTLICKDSFSTEMEEIDYNSYTVDWSCMQYGFCKLRSRSLESYKSRVFRIYFNPELYIRKYEELNGVPYAEGRKLHRNN